ncbi:MAG: helix-turn-helix domain-containing protein [Myxococcales bacterium]|nr:helix-turn-helix domain-containing protein [Myxococcales bacterium]
MTPFRRNKLYRMAKNGEIPGARKLGGTWQFHRETLLAWLDCRAP